MTKKEELKGYCKQAFTDFIKINTGQNRKFNESVTNNKALDTFIGALEKRNNGLEGLDIYSIYQYVLFQFHRISASNELGGGYSKFGGAVIMVSWVFGAKAFEKWKSKSDSWLFVATKYYKRKHNVVFEELISFKDEQQEGDIIEAYELDKERFFNKIEGFALCLDLGYSFDKRSSWCGKCNFAKRCRKLNGQ